MLTVIPLGFDHDYKDKADRFREFAAQVSSLGCFDSKPIVEGKAFFSYGRFGRTQLDLLQQRIGDQPAILFLSEVCCYSYAIVQSPREVTGNVTKLWEYDSFSSFVQSPNVLGYAVPADGIVQLLDNDCLVVSLMPSPYSTELVNEDTDEPNREIINILQASCSRDGSVYAYRIRDPQRYFNSIRSFDWPIYATRDEIDVDLALKHFRNETLTEYLLSLPVAFGTLNDNHQDDFYAVSYRKPFWKADEESLAFIA